MFIFPLGFGCIRGNLVCPQWCLVVDANGCKSCPCGPGNSHFIRQNVRSFVQVSKLVSILPPPLSLSHTKTKNFNVTTYPTVPYPNPPHPRTYLPIHAIDRSIDWSFARQLVGRSDGQSRNYMYTTYHELCMTLPLKSSGPRITIDFWFLCILNQIPNATSNTFLNNSKSTKCRLIPFKPWLDKCVRHSIFMFE